MIKGYSVIVGKDGKSGFFEYSKTKKEAKEKGEVMKAMLENNFEKGDLTITIQSTKLKNCDNKNCVRLCPSDENYCLKCEDLMYEAQYESQEAYENDEVLNYD